MLLPRVLGSAALVIAGLTQPTTAEQIGPSFDCSAARQPLAQILCADSDLSQTDLRFVQAYFALLPQLDDAAKRELKQEDLRFLDAVQQHCGIPPAGPIPAQSDALRKCVKDAYESQRSVWLLRLRPPFSEEASRPIERHMALQRLLQQFGFLPADARVDGVYGPGTREAISRWQSAYSRSMTGVLADSDAQALEKQASEQSTPVTEAAGSDFKGDPSRNNSNTSPANANTPDPLATNGRKLDTRTGVGDQPNSPQQTPVAETTPSSATATADHTKTENSLSDSEAATLAGRFMGAETYLTIPLGNMHFILGGYSQPTLDAATKANFVKTGNTGMLGDTIVIATPLGQKFATTGGPNGPELHVPLGAFKASTIKDESFSGKLKEFRILLGTYELIYSDDYKKIAESYTNPNNRVCQSGKFQMLLSRDGFPGSKWQHATLDLSCGQNEFSTHVVNDTLARTKMGIE